MNKEQFEVLAKELHHLHLENSEESSQKARATSNPIFYVQEKHLVGVVGLEAYDYSPDGPYGGGVLKTEYYDPNSCISYESVDDIRENCEDFEDKENDRRSRTFSKQTIH